MTKTAVILQLLAGTLLAILAGLYLPHSITKESACAGGAPHKWSKWETDSDQKDLKTGYVRQRRYCDQCGLLQLTYVQ